MLLGLLLAIVFDQVYLRLTVESTNCLFDLEQAGGSLDRNYLVHEFLPPSSLSFSFERSPLKEEKFLTLDGSFIH